MHFSLVMEGQESFEKKFEQSLKDNPTLHMDLIKAFGHAVMMALRLNEEDKISIASFRAGKVNEQPEEKKIED